MKKVNKLALQFTVPATNFAGYSLYELEKLHEHTLSSVGLSGYTGEFGKDDTYAKSIVSTPAGVADVYYLPDSHEVPLVEIVGLDPSCYFQNILQVCLLLQQNWKILTPIRFMGINSGRTSILFPFMTHDNKPCLGNIGVWYEKTTFSSGIEFVDSEYKDSSLREYYGNGQRGFAIVLPADNKASFLSDPNDLEISSDYKNMPLEDFQEHIKTISETTQAQPDEYIKREDKIEERVRVELTYLDRCHPWGPVTFNHPDGSFDFRFQV